MSAQLLSLSERMLVAARADDWETVASLEAERREQLASLSLTGPDALPLLKTLLAHTEQVRELAGRQRDRLGDALGQHQHRHRALSAYLQAGFD